MNRIAGIAVAFFIVIASAGLGSSIWHHFLDEGRGPASRMPAGSSVSSVSIATSSAARSGIDNTGLSLSVPAGFQLDIFAEGVSGARDITRDMFGNFWVSRTSEGIVSQLDLQSGSGVQVSDVLRGLRNPHGLTVDPSGLDLYIAEETSIKRARLYSDAPIQTIAELPAGGRHVTRTIRYGPDDKLYISIGSTCDVCIEGSNEYGAILSMNTDGSNRQIIAEGLRNAVFFTWSYVDGQMYAADMGRDNLGDDLPPEEINKITEGAHYGWPYCYADQVRDETFRPGDNFDCSNTEPPHVAFQAHSAPLGMVFIPEEGWPEEYWYDLLIARHGSWNRSEPVGYDVLRIPLDAEGNPEGEPVPFIEGWLNGGNETGRPVSLLIEPGGILYITDDKAGVVYKLSRTGENL